MSPSLTVIEFGAPSAFLLRRKLDEAGRDHKHFDYGAKVKELTLPNLVTRLIGERLRKSLPKLEANSSHLIITGDAHAPPEAYQNEVYQQLVELADRAYVSHVSTFGTSVGADIIHEALTGKKAPFTDERRYGWKRVKNPDYQNPNSVFGRIPDGGVVLCASRYQYEQEAKLSRYREGKVAGKLELLDEDSKGTGVFLAYQLEDQQRKVAGSAAYPYFTGAEEVRLFMRDVVGSRKDSDQIVRGAVKYARDNPEEASKQFSIVTRFLSA